MRCIGIVVLCVVLGVPSVCAALEDELSPFVRLGPSPRPPAPYSPWKPVPLPVGFVRGVCYPSPSSPTTEYGTPGCQAMLKAIRATGATAVSLCPHFLVRERWPFGLAKFPGVADRDATRQTIMWARELGLEVHLRPQVVTRAGRPRFRLDIEHREDWAQLFGVLDTLLNDLGTLGAETGCRVLSLGTRLEELSGMTPQNWRTLISRVRAVFPGLITYDADWRREAERVPFWADLDVVSITLYKRLGEAEKDDDPPLDRELNKQARWPTGRLSELFYGLGKPVWISEVGFPSNAAGARHPFQRPLERGHQDAVLQARMLNRTLLTYQDKRWLSGLMVWGITGPGGVVDRNYTPAEKPAWDELTRWFAPGPARSREYYDEKDLVPWIDDYF